MLKIIKKSIFKKTNRLYKKTRFKYTFRPFLHYTNRTVLFKSNKNPVYFHYLIRNSVCGRVVFVYYTYNKYFYFANPLLYPLSFTLKHSFKFKYKPFIGIFRYFFIKIRFYGKTFRWIFTKKKIKFKVQKAHKTYILFKHLRFSRKKKLKLKLRIFLLNDKTNMILCLKKIKYVNLFTKKGLRVLRTKLFKKKGKVSGYMVGL